MGSILRYLTAIPAEEFLHSFYTNYNTFLQVSRIARHRQVPKHVKSAQAELKLIKESKARKEANRRKHSKPGAVPNISEREAHTVEEKE